MGVFPHGWCTMQNTIQTWMMYPGYPPFYLRINISSFRDALTMPPIACDLLGLRVDRFFADALLKKLDGWEDRKLPLGCQSNHSFGHQPLVNNLSRKLGLYIPFIPFHGAMHAYFQLVFWAIFGSIFASTWRLPTPGTQVRFRGNTCVPGGVADLGTSSDDPRGYLFHGYMWGFP